MMFRRKLECTGMPRWIECVVQNFVDIETVKLLTF